jgi:hypothetical protein
MNGLMLHTGAKALSGRDELASLPVGKPMGSRHAIRPFIDDVMTVTEQLAKIGMPVVNESFGVTRGEDGVPKQFFGLMECKDERTYTERDHGLMIGLRGSYDQTLPRGMAIGGRVFVCDNLCFSGEITVKTKQTLDIDARIADMLRDAISRVPQFVAHQDRRFDNYKHVEIGQTVGNSMLTDLVRIGALNASQIGVALKEWDNPRHAEHAQHGWSLWRLHNACTEALKPANKDTNAVQRNWGRTIQLTDMLDREVEHRLAA